MSLNRLAFSATVHCLTGCAIGEVLGMIIGTALGWGDWETIALAVALAFLFGYSLTMVPLVRGGLALGAAIPVALAADTISITIMEIVDNAIMLLIPGAMEAGLDEPAVLGQPRGGAPRGGCRRVPREPLAHPARTRPRGRPRLPLTARLESPLVRVLFASTQGTGHFGPLIPLIDACHRNGHETLVVGPPTLKARGYEFEAGATPPDEILRAAVAIECRPFHPHRERWSWSASSSPG